MEKRMYISKRRLYCELQAQNNNKLQLKKPPSHGGIYIFKDVYPSSVLLIRTRVRNRTKTRKQINEEEKKERKISMAELMRRIFGGEQRSMDLARGDYPMHYEGGRLLL